MVCESSSCDSKFSCNGRCLSLSDFCNGDSKCETGFDESKSVCSGKPKSEACEQYQVGDACLCTQGYNLEQGYKCKDVDECKFGRKCDQFCKNTEGSYTCSCADGFEVSQNGKCKLVGKEKPYLLFSVSSGLKKYTLGASNLLDVKKTQQFQIYQKEGQSYAIKSVDFHHAKNLLFYADSKTRKIYRTLLKESFDKQPADGIIPTPILNAFSEGISIDYLNDKIYFTTTDLNTIEVSELDGTNRHLLHYQRVENPRTILVVPEVNKIFWLDQSASDPRIESSNLDGTRRKKIVQAGGFESTVFAGLTVDKTKKRLYYALISWMSAASSTYIESCDYDGKNRRKLISKRLNVVESLSLFNGEIFIAENTLLSTQNAIQRASSLSGAKLKKFYSNSQSMLVAAVVN